MQILASALPGFRDLRAPLTAGYLWLVLAWIVLKPDLSKPPTNEILRAVYDLAKAAGPVWIGLAIGVTAYLVGAVLQVFSQLIQTGISAIWRQLYSYYDARQVTRNGKPGKLIPKLFLNYHRDPVDKYELLAVDKLYANPSRNDYGEIVNPDEEIGRRGQQARRGIDQEISLPATLLLSAQPQLFTEADRLKAESQFRLALVPPLGALAVYLVLQSTNWWAVLLVPLVILIGQAQARNLEYRYLVYGAIEVGLVESQSLNNMKQWIESIPPPAYTGPRQRNPLEAVHENLRNLVSYVNEWAASAYPPPENRKRLFVPVFWKWSCENLAPSPPVANPPSSEIIERVHELAKRFDSQDVLRYFRNWEKAVGKMITVHNNIQSHALGEVEKTNLRADFEAWRKYTVEAGNEFTDEAA